MPYEIMIPVTVEKVWTPTYHDQRAARALLLSAWQREDAMLSQEIHDARRKPFTQYLGREEERLLWRITLLDEAIYAPLMAGLLKTKEPHIAGRPVAFDLHRASSSHTPYAFLAAAQAKASYKVRFSTPAAFKRAKFHYPLPDPALCFQSWWDRWAIFAPAELAINVAVVDVVQAHMAIASLDLRSEVWEDENEKIIGSQGRMTFAALKRGEVEASWWHDVATLAAFAPFCGTGVKTTRGLGQTKIVV